MREFALPLGMFQVHAATSVLADALTMLKTSLEVHEQLLQEIRDDPDKLVTRNTEIMEMIVRIADDSDAFNRALKEAVEFPETLPAITRQLIFASIVVQAFRLRFEIVDFEQNAERGGLVSWHVTGRLVEKDGRSTTEGGVSFSFPPDDEKKAEGALLSACTDAFVHCVHSVVPFFPWDRLNVYEQD